MAEKKRLAIFTPKKSLVGIRGMYRWILVTLTVGTISIFVMLGVNKWVTVDKTPIMASVWEVFFAVFGIMYAIIVGLFLVESFRRWGEMSSIIHSEINAIGDIDDCLRFFGNHGKNQKVKEDIAESLCCYVELMADDWEIMKDPRTKETIERHEERGLWPIIRDWFKTTRKEYRITLYKDEGVRPVIEEVCELQAKSDSERHAMEVICDRVFEITTHRANRLELVEHGLSSGLYLLIPFMSVVLLVSTMLLPVDNLWVHGFIVFSTTVALAALLMLLIDLDHPFTGLFGIDKEMLNDIKRKLNCPVHISAIGSLSTRERVRRSRLLEPRARLRPLLANLRRISRYG